MLQVELDLTPEQQDLEEALRALSHNAEDVFQIDWPGAEAVLRCKDGERLWTLAARGSWSQEDVLVLVRHGLLRKTGQSAMGWEIQPRPELLGAC